MKATICIASEIEDLFEVLKSKTIELGIDAKLIECKGVKND